ncbi:hypothetical protein MIR68_008549 [Amoeboaphelidium protococcarum]|nr:hypothetical protein MIR68_008549 [Amoeboaphelidium protococcarum]KAI3644265.1 hypothetical protein MP228_010429 [Amoeboaphelidium protococcarum]
MKQDSHQLQYNTLERELTAKLPPTTSQVSDLHELIRPHLDSFNAITELSGDGAPLKGKSAKMGLLDLSVADIDPKEVRDHHGNRIRYWYEDVRIGPPKLDDSNRRAIDRRMMPTECRERGLTYEGPLSATIKYEINGVVHSIDNKQLGMTPIMVKSNLCHLYGMNPQQLIKSHEESEELGGYFIINGIEKLVRLLIVNRRNHPMAIVRPSFQKRGATYSNYGVMIRCVRPDQTSHSVTIHYLTDGNITFRFTYRKQEYMLPAVMVMKALVSCTDKEIYESIVQEDHDNTFITDRVEMMLRQFKNYSLNTQSQCVAFIGSKFRAVLDQPEDATDYEVGQKLLQKVVFVHLQDNRDKFNLLIYMIQKLYAVVSGDACPDSPDSPQHQEVLLGGFLYSMILKEKLEDYLLSIKQVLQMELRRNKSVDFLEAKVFTRAATKATSNIGKMLNYFLATGNLLSSTGLDLSQASGYSIVAEKLNYFRYMAHFRSIHRGAFFAELKTTAVRKLLPEAWGFLCPIHTPDGSPCGLLNHLAHRCKVTTEVLDVSAVEPLLVEMGMKPVLKGAIEGIAGKSCQKIVLDGKVIGYCTPELLRDIAKKLRYLKVTKQFNIPLDLEIGYVPTSRGGQYSGLCMFSTPTRFMRPVKYLANDQLDMVGSYEQVFMDIACMEEDVVTGITTHIEFDPTDILSIMANLTPFSDQNQSCRVIYNAQQSKQSMSNPLHAYPYRSDNKLYRLITCQSPIVRPKLYGNYGVDNYPGGFNSIVAVISYTGYDMEDAMILNKKSYEFGFMHGVIMKHEYVDLGEMRVRGESIIHHFRCTDTKKLGKDKLGPDGLPLVGVKLSNGDPYYSYVIDTTGECKVVKYKGLEDAVVEDVRLIGIDAGTQELQKIGIKLRVNRNPVIGDKFSSRHGQKGICSQKYQVVNLPFTESGIMPDLIINAHAFPSRMTIGQFVESMGAKAGAALGKCYDATPFKFNEQDTIVDYFGEQLREAGFNYYGNEPMYSGITGEELNVDIYIGIVMYQRLRHMVSDKYQVRTTGPIDNLTHQPVKGRKRAGGIRFGEMERDSLLAHGVSFCLQDRLMNCSDYSVAHVCKPCGSILSPSPAPPQQQKSLPSFNADGVSLQSSLKQPGESKIICSLCKKSDGIDVVAIPYVFRYLSTELMAMNIRMKLEVK